MSIKPTSKVVNTIIDISHHNGNVNMQKAKDAGIIAVIVKATQHVNWFDNMFVANWAKAKRASLMRGAYHFGTYGDGAKQADWFLSKVQPDDQTLCVLDLEDNPSRLLKK